MKVSFKCYISVTGERGAGKSTLVNLLAGCKILPTDMLYGTRTICELRHSKTRKFILHSWDTLVAPVVKECHADDDSGQFLNELTSHVTCVDGETDQSPYEMIEIYWPMPVFGVRTRFMNTFRSLYASRVCLLRLCPFTRQGLSYYPLLSEFCRLVTTIIFPLTNRHNEGSGLGINKRKVLYLSI